jgi:hypothetical protein
MHVVVSTNHYFSDSDDSNSQTSNIDDNCDISFLSSESFLLVLKKKIGVYKKIKIFIKKLKSRLTLRRFGRF